MKERVRGLPGQVGAAELNGTSRVWRKQKNGCGRGGRKVAFSGLQILMPSAREKLAKGQRDGFPV